MAMIDLIPLIVFGYGFIVLVMSFFTKDNKEARTLRIVGCICVGIPLLLLGGCMMLFRGMRIE